MSLRNRKMRESGIIRKAKPPTWRDALESERDLSNRLHRVLLENGIDHATVEEWIEEHDRSELLLRPITKQEIRVNRMYAKELEN